MKIKLKDLKVGDKVWCGGDSGFCTDSIEKVKKIEWKFDENNGKKYKVIVLGESRKFDSRDGGAINPPLAYYLVPIEQKQKNEG